MIEEAIIYGKNGWRVFPVKYKVPSIKGWQEQASTKASKITELFKNPHTGIGLATGKQSGVTVVDIDNKNGVNGFHTLDVLGLEMPETVCVLTPSGGRQYYFRYCPDIKNMVAALGDGSGIDIRNDGGLVILPPSIHPNGKEYEWLADQGPADLELAQFPADLLKAINERIKPKDKTFDLPEKIAPGQRNDTLFKYACKLRTSGLEASEIISAVSVVNRERCYEPLPDDELKLIVDSACGYEKGHPEEQDKNEITFLLAEKFLAENGNTVFCIEEKAFYRYANGVYKQTPDEVMQKALLDKIPWTKKLTCAKRNNILENMRILTNKPLEDFNAGEILNLENGLYDIKAAKFIPHHPGHISTIRLPYNYVAGQGCPMWEKTLNEIFENDQNKIRTIQEFFGYCLTKDTHFEKALIMLGEGQNGKSTVLYVLENLVGIENCSTLSLKYFNDPSMVCALVNKFVNINSEVPRRAEDYETEFRTITSGESVNANQKYVPIFKFRPFCKLIFAANEMPYIDDRTSGFYRRLLMVPFERSFSEEEQNKNLKKELLSELPGILNWALAGLKRLYERKMFLIDEYMKQNISSLKKQNNPVEIFVDDCIGFEKDLFTYKTELFEKYKKWCEENGYKPLASHKFSESFFRIAKKFTKKDARENNSNRTRIWPGVFIKNESQHNFDKPEGYVPPKDRPY